jgi:hypothetical protein
MKYARRIYSLLFSVLLLSTLMLAVALAGVSRKDEPKQTLPFAPAEELVYEGEFSRSLLRGLDIAELRFTVGRAQDGPHDKDSDASVPEKILFKAEAVSKGLLQKLFGVRFRQQIESTVDARDFTVLQTTKVDEQGSRLRTSDAIFNRHEGKVVWTERDPKNPAREPRVVTSDLNGSVQDITSAIYFLRTQTLTPGKSFEIAVSDSGRVYRVPVRVAETKRMKTVLGQVQAVRVEADIFGEGRLMRGKGSMSIWFTNDARRIPVKARINNEMGTLNIKLKKVTNGQAS